MIPLLNQFIIMFGFGTVEAMIAPHMKKNGASDFDVGLLFLEVGTTSILGSVLFAQVCTNKIYALIITIYVTLLICVILLLTKYHYLHNIVF